jgi:hypothetical protein
MGVSCQLPNSIACDRIGLSVWLRRPALAVTATIAGASLKLNDPNWSGTARVGRRPAFVFAGFLQPAGIISRLRLTPDPGGKTWMAHPDSSTSSMTGAAPAPAPRVQVRIDYGHGRIVLTELNVALSPGWG